MMWNSNVFSGTTWLSLFALKQILFVLVNRLLEMDYPVRWTCISVSYSSICLAFLSPQVSDSTQEIFSQLAVVYMLLDR